MTEELTCPHCCLSSDPCDFPDWLWADSDVDEYPDQYDILMDMQKVGFNVVTCGRCGEVFLHRTGRTING